MTMAPGQRRGFWLEILLASLLLFLLVTARSEAKRGDGATSTFSSVGRQQTFLTPPAMFE